MAGQLTPFEGETILSEKSAGQLDGLLKADAAFLAQARGGL